MTPADKIPSNPAPSATEATSPKWYDELNAEIEKHKAEANNRSYLGDAVDFLWHFDSASLTKLEKLKAEADADIKSNDPSKLAAVAKEEATDVTDDQKELQRADLAISIGSGVLKTAPLFLGGPVGWVASAALSGLDEAKPGQDIEHQALSFAVGATKGVLVKASLGLMTALPLGSSAVALAAKGTVVGMAQRAINATFDSRNYYDKKNQLDAGSAVKNILSTTINPAAIATDAATFGIASAGNTLINTAFGDVMANNSYLQTIATGATMGLVSGMSREATTEWQTNHSINPLEIAKAGALQMSIQGAGAAIGGGVQAAMNASEVSTTTSADAAKQNGSSESAASKPEDQTTANQEPAANEQKVLISGPNATPESHQILTTLSHNLIPFQKVETSDGSTADDSSAAGGDSVVTLPNGTKLVNPTAEQLGQALNLHMHPNSSDYDLAVVGAGPAGLTAGIYGASEGLKTLIIDQDGPGGQAGTSSRIENYPGFPDGISGHDLTTKAVDQANRLGAELVTLRGVTGLADNGGTKTLTLSDGTEINAKAVIVATGMTPKPLDAPGLSNLKDAGVYYGAGSEEADTAQGAHVAIIGGANSAGQAAVNFANHQANVDLILRGDSINKDMSDYLVRQIADNDAISVHTNSVVAAATGADHLQEITLKNVQTGATQTLPADDMLVFIGSVPSSTWCNIAMDSQGYVLTGRDLGSNWGVTSRLPFESETSMPGVFTAGDVEHGDIHRVATAVGSGASAVASVHKYLASTAVQK